MESQDTATLMNVGKLVLGGFIVMLVLIAIANAI